MAGFKPAGRKYSASRPFNNGGGDAARFAAANLPPCKGERHDSGPMDGAGPQAGLSPEALAARAAAAQYDAMYGDVSPSRGRRSPMLIMGLVFAIGAGAGLAGAKWFAGAQKNPTLSAPVVALSTPVTTAVDPDGQERALRGIRPSELPYDGRPSLQDEDEKAAPQEAKPATPETPAAPPVASKAPEEKAEAVVAPPPPAVKEPKLAAADEPRAADQDRQQAKAEAVQPPAKPAKRAEAPRKPVRTASVAKEKSREVERMRREADEELSKKTASAAPEERRNSAPSKLQQVSTALASCERRSNIILREHCRWQVCNGMWGKNGCPSYASARRDPYAY